MRGRGGEHSISDLAEVFASWPTVYRVLAADKSAAAFSC
jgi:hypothetical protein